MSQNSTLKELLGPMVDHEVDLEGEAFRVDRARVLSRMARVEVPARRRWPERGRMSYALLAAAGVALFIGMRVWQRDVAANASLEIIVSEGSAIQSQGASRAAVAPHQVAQVVASGELETAVDSKARVRTTDGLQIDLESQTRIGLDDLRGQPTHTRKVTLLGGAIRCNIPHRASPREFQVVAAGITVVDLGTVFTVSVDDVHHSTRVVVEEGEVVVRDVTGETHVQAPGIWTNAKAPIDPPVVTAPSATTSAAPAPRLSNAPLVPTAATPPSSPRSSVATNGKALPAPTLAEEARLLRQGLAAERQGRFPDATTSLTRLLVNYPHSPLAPDARAALARIEARTPR